MSPDKSLAEILSNRMRASEPIPVPLTLAILRQVCDSLDYAHNLRDPTGQPLGIIHRDVSPAHIYVAETGRVTLVASTTQHGTFAYMAPEYVMSGMLDWRADLFGLGVVAYEMLTNRPLFATGDDRETLDRVCALPIPPPSSLNPQVAPDLDGIVLMALARDPAYRWQHAAMMRDGLQYVAQRLGLELAPTHSAPWLDLLAERVEHAPVAPAFVEYAQAAPPGDPELWAEDNNNTRIQPIDPEVYEAALAEDLAAAAASVSASGAASASAAPAPGLARAPVPVPLAPAPAPGPARTPAPVPLAPAPAPVPAPLAQAPVRTPAPVPLASGPAPVPAPLAPEPASTRAPAPAPEMDPELGPEPTHIGAMPLISFGDTPLVSSIGENARRTPALSLPPPSATFLPEAVEPPSPDRTKRLAILAGLVIVTLVVIVIVLAVR